MKYEITLLRSRRDLTPLEDVAERCGVHPEIVRRFMDAGLLEPVEISGATILFDSKAVNRVRIIHRLRRDLGINLPGIAVILDLLERYGHQ